ncbi:MAG: class I SAM-dependent DNA methyltransferase [Oligoflexia bacterium]|nr:class I SAM-dependent DNA methyltransferase [Oligoflexia bacterium]
MPKNKAENSKVLIENKLWSAADSLRKNIDAAEYKHIVLGLIFLKYISDSFQKIHDKLQNIKNADPEDRDEYKAEKVFFVPPSARWSYLCSRAKLPEIGKDIDSAMSAIEKDNPSLKNVLPKVYARGNLDPINLGKLIDEFSNIDMESAKDRNADILGHVFEYFLGQFGLAEGKKGGQFYTPLSVVKLLVEMLEPYKGRVFDPCCGTGGMFVQSEKFIKEHQGLVKDISVYGQESNQTTWRLAKMNLAIRGIGSLQIKWNNEGSFLNDEHPDLKADFVIANPPFNDSNWSGNLLKKDGRWKYGVPPAGNANFAWIQHFVYHLSPKGAAGFVMAKGSLTSKSSNEDRIRKNLVNAGLVDCIVNLPAKLFLNTQIPASLWFLRRGKTKRKEEVLFIDARNLGHLITRRNRVLDDKDIKQISAVYHNWKSGNKSYKDIPGFCCSVSVNKIKELDYVLSPGRYVGLPETEDDFNFSDRFNELKNKLEEQMKEEAVLNKRILKNLERVDYEK